ncbi:MAG: carboxypeptidase-like regulatory domain-containing protein, partial [Rhodanobacter sp.]|nr:carboxypeptidase-like regulatory domain-containing protein [Rhodanobacter sp.]
MKPLPKMLRRPIPTLLTCALASCLLLTTPSGFAQSTDATLRGLISVGTAPAKDAKVSATNLATGLSRAVQASADGSYSLNGLPPGSYRIDVSAAGKT